MHTNCAIKFKCANIPSATAMEILRFQISQANIAHIYSSMLQTVDIIVTAML